MLFILMITFTISIKCSDKTIEGTYYLKDSEVKLEFSSNKLKVYDYDMPIYKAIQIEKSEHGYRYEITDIMLMELWVNHKKPWLSKGNEFTIKMSEDERDTELIRLAGEDFGEYEYEISDETQSYYIIQNVYLKEVEKTQLKDMNLNHLTKKFNLIPITKTDIQSKLKKIFLYHDKSEDEQSDTSVVLPFNLVNKVGLEYSVNTKPEITGPIDESKSDELMKNKDIILKAISVTIPEEDYFKDRRPKTLTILFSTTGKANPAYYQYLYDTKVTLNIKDMPEKQIFFLMEDITSIYSMTIIIDNFYEGLTDNITISEIDFYIQ